MTSPAGKILVVDDDPDIREALCQALELEGYGVATAANGRQAWEMLGEGSAPALILLDLMMPVMNGAELLALIRSDGRLQTVPVVVVSAFGSRFPAAAEQAQGCLPKPVDLDQLVGVVAQYCGATPP